MSGLAPIMPNEGDEHVTFEAADGWRISGVLRLPVAAALETDAPAMGAVLVPGSHHERDTFVYGRGLPDALAERGIASIRIDIRGRGESRSPRSWRQLSTLERRRVADDVAAASDVLRARAGIDDASIAIICEQDTARAAALAAVRGPLVGALVMLSPRLDKSTLAALANRRLPTYAMVSKEDRRALRDATRAYLAGADSSELQVFSGLGFGATMFMSRAFEQPDEVPLQEMIGDWVQRTL
jgi:dienelactone hydrolase